MHVLREKQKTIIWLVAIIVIPSFVLLWGGGGASMMGARDGVAIAEVYGETVTDLDLREFDVRLRAAMGGQRFLVYNNPMGDLDQKTDGLFSLVLAKSFLRTAEKAGIRVADAEVGTAIRSERAFWDNPMAGTFSEQAYRKRLEQMQLNNEQYKEGVRESLLLDRFMDLFNQTTTVTDDTAYLRYAEARAELTFRKVTVYAEKLEDAAKDELFPDGMTKDEEREKLTAWLDENKQNRRYWTKPKWRFDYVLVPLDLPGYKPEVSDDDLQRYFDMHKTDYPDKDLADVRDEVRAAVEKERHREMAEYVLREKVDYLIAETLRAGKEVDLQTLAQDDSLKKWGVVAGSSGNTAVPSSQFEDIPLVGDAVTLGLYLDRVGEFEDEAERDEYLAKLKSQFDTFEPPLESDKGYFRIRLTEFVAPERRDFDTDDALRLEVAEAMMKEKARDLAYQKAEEYANRIRTGDVEEFDFATENVEYSRAPDELRTAQLGEPVLRRTAEGTDVLVLVKQAIPPRSEFDALDPLAKGRLRQRVLQNLKGGWQRSYQGMSFVMLSPHMQMFIQQMLETGDIKVLWRPEAETGDE